MRSKFLRVFYATLLVVAAVAVLPGQSQATWIDLTASTSFVNDYIDWAQLGPDSTVVPTPVTVTTGVYGHSVTLSGTGSFERLDQGTGWGGNFAPGDALIYNGDGAMNLNFTSTNPLFIFQTQIQGNDFGPFTATISAYDKDGNLLHSFSEVGDSNADGNNSAIVIGLETTLKEMTEVRLSIVNNEFGHQILPSTRWTCWNAI